MDRRKFLCNSSVLALSLASPRLTLGEALGPFSENSLYFGYGKTGIGSKLGISFCEALFRQGHLTHNFNFVSEPGNKTLTATHFIKNSLPEDRVLLEVTSSLVTVFPTLFSQLSYDPLVDFKPLCCFGYNAFMLVVGPAVDKSVETIDDYIKWVRANPEFREIGNTYYGSESHLASLILAREKKTALRSLYYGGTSLMVEDMKAKELAACIMISGNALAEFESGEFRALAVCSKKRHQSLPDIPTMYEQGVGDIDIRGWYGILAPTQIDPSIYEFYLRLTGQALSDNEFKSLCTKLLLDPGPGSPQALQAQIKQDMNNYKLLFDKYYISQV